MKIIGLTGQSGTGKSTFAIIAEQKGFTVIDCDKVAHETARVPSVLDKLENSFGNVVINGNLDRKALAAKAFITEEGTEKLNRIMLPAISDAISKKIEKLEESGTEYLILDAPTLFESGIDKNCSAIVAVLADKSIRKNRIVKRDTLTAEQLEARLAASKPDTFYTEKTGYIIYNNGSENDFNISVDEMLEKLKLL